MALGANLRSIRNDLGYDEDYVARRLGASSNHLSAIELEQSEPDANDLAVFSDLYGVELDRLWTGEIAADEASTLRLLFLRNTRVALPERTRAAIARAALIARQYVDLGATLALPSAYSKLRATQRHEGVYAAHGQPWRIGEELGLRVRGDYEFNSKPIRCLRDFAESVLGILIIHTDLRSSAVAACSFSSANTGPVIVTNSAGENARPWRWRFTVAHEICHVLFDELSQNDLGSVTSYEDQEDDSSPDEVEQRANSFAITLLAPKEGLRGHLAEIKSQPLPAQIRDLMTTWGINFKAARYRLKHLGWLSAPQANAIRGVDVTESEEWLTAEADLLDTFFPCPSVPSDRRGAFARRLVHAFTAGHVSRAQMIGLLEAAPDDPLDQLVSLVTELDSR